MADEYEELLSTLDLRRDGDIERATSAASSIDDVEDRALALLALTKALLNAGREEQARAAARSITRPYEKVEALHAVALRIAGRGLVKQAAALLSEASRTAEQAREQWQQAELLNLLARAFHDIQAGEEANENWGKAIRIAEHGEESADPQDSVDSASVLGEIAETLFQVGQTERALEVARAIKNTGKRDRVLNRLGPK